MTGEGRAPPDAAAPLARSGWLGWIWVALGAILAVGCASDSIWLGTLFFLLSVVLVAPPLLGYYRANELRDGLRRVAAAALAFGGLIAIGASPATSPAAESTQPKVEKSPGDAAKARADLKALWGRVLATAQTCDAANTKATEALGVIDAGDRDIYEVYGLAKQAHEVCKAAWLEIGNFDAPGSLAPSDREKVTQTLKRCELAYFSRQESLEVMMRVIDGDVKPSTVQEFTEGAKAAQAGTMLCVAGFIEAGATAGET